MSSPERPGTGIPGPALSPVVEVGWNQYHAVTQGTEIAQAAHDRSRERSAAGKRHGRRRIPRCSSRLFKFCHIVQRALPLRCLCIAEPSQQLVFSNSDAGWVIMAADHPHGA